MKIKKILFNKYTLWAALLLSGFILGGLIFHKSYEKTSLQEETVHDHIETIWTCSMHPQIRMDNPGNCPICGMELIPLVQKTAALNPDAIVMTEEGIKLAEVQTSIVSSQKPVKEVRLYGKIQADERLIQTQPAHIPGRIEKLMVNFTGEEVQKGQVIAWIYSPELVTAQEELQEAIKMKELQPRILEAAREKLRQWKLNDAQIEEIEKSGTAKSVFEVFANVSGIVINRRVSVGDYVAQGAPLFEIADLSHVWALFDAYESDLPWIRKGDVISFTLQAQPGKQFSGNITFIDPVINPQTRVARVRVEMSNKDNILKPEMFATGIVSAHLSSSAENLIIPQSAVLWTGTRSVVYIKIPDAKEPSFVIRDITLGPALDNSYVVVDGLTEGEEIVTNGTFSVDASAQLEGKPSMMNPRGGKTNTMPGMVMPGDTKPENDQKTSGQNMPEKIEVSMDFTMQLNKVYEKYIILKNAFVSSDEKKVQESSQDVFKAISNINMNLLKGTAMSKWMEFSVKLKNEIKRISSAESLEAQRKEFSIFNDSFYKVIETFGLMDKTVYYQFCPMANENNGAYWLSEKKEILNPYYGEAMLTCGETKETLKY